MAIILYYGEFQHYSFCENWIADALERGGHHCVRIQRVKWFDEQRLLTIARQTEATHVLFTKVPELLPEQIRTLKQGSLKVMFWTFDWMKHPKNWEWYSPQAREADVCFQTDGFGEQAQYDNDGIVRVELHQGCVPGLHELPNGENDPDVRYGIASYGSDIAFIGSTYTDRRKELLAHLKLYDGFRKWGEPQPQVWGRQFAAVAGLSKIVVGDNFVNDVEGYWSDRVYLTLGCGGFFLTAYVPGLEMEFENHRHLVWWKNFEELNELVKYYLPRESERRAIALEGYRLVHAQHTYDKRIQTMSHYL